MSDSLRRFWEQHQALHRAVDPLGDFRRQVGALSDAYKLLDACPPASPLQREMQAQQDAVSKVLASHRQVGLGGDAIGRLMDEANRHRRLLDNPLEQVRQQLASHDALSAAYPSIVNAVSTARDLHERMFRVPGISEAMRLAQEVRDASPLVASVFGHGRFGRFDTALLGEAMAGMSSPWARADHLGTSARAFAEVQAMGRILNERPPFEQALGASLRPTLGDWRDVVPSTSELFTTPVLRSSFYLERGFDPAVTDFPARAFNESLRVAGLQDHREDVPDLTEADTDRDGSTRAERAYSRLRRLETAVRRLIKEVMYKAYGETWMKQRLPPGMLASWRDKREAAVKACVVGAADCPLIDYADFSDYLQIIERRDNWREVFKGIFGRPEDVRESFQRLFPVRIATMHARFVTLGDELLLVVEMRRLMRAIEKASATG